MTRLRKTTWNTYRTTCFTCDVANDRASSGGVHLHQVRRTKRGWQLRVCQSNGRHEAYGPVEAVSDEIGEANFARAQQG